MYTNEQKQQIYKNWVARGRPWFNIDKSKEPTWEEHNIILEIKKQENEKVKRDIELQKREAVPRRVNENQVKKFDRLMRGF